MKALYKKSKIKHNQFRFQVRSFVDQIPKLQLQHFKNFKGRIFLFNSFLYILYSLKFNTKLYSLANEQHQSVLEKNSLYKHIKDQKNKIFVLKNQKDDVNLKLHKAILKLKDKVKKIEEIVISESDAKELFNSNNNPNLILPNTNVYEIVFMNSSGDVEFFSFDEFISNTEKDEKLNFYDEINSLSSLEDIKLLNDNEFMFLFYVKSKDKSFLNFSNLEFTFFRKLFYNLNFMNLKYFVTSNDIANLGLESGFYLIKRPTNATESINLINIDGEPFQILDISSELNQSNKNENLKNALSCPNKSVDLLLNTCFSNNFTFYSYTNNAIGLLHGVELFPLFFKNIPYYIFFTDLSIESNKRTFEEVLTKTKMQQQIIVVDNDKYSEKQYLVKTFNDKYFETKEFLEAEKESDIDHFFPQISKKIMISNFEEAEVDKIINSKDVSYENNSLIDAINNKENSRPMLIDNVILKNYLSNPTKQFFLYIANIDTKKNRNSSSYLLNLKKEIYTYYNTSENIKYLNDYLNKNCNSKIDSKNSPQLIKFNKGSCEVLDSSFLLYYDEKIAMSGINKLNNMIN